MSNSTLASKFLISLTIVSLTVGPLTPLRSLRAAEPVAPTEEVAPSAETSSTDASADDQDKDDKNGFEKVAIGTGKVVTYPFRQFGNLFKRKHKVIVDAAELIGGDSTDLDLPAPPPPNEDGTPGIAPPPPPPIEKLDDGRYRMRACNDFAPGVQASISWGSQTRSAQVSQAGCVSITWPLGSIDSGTNVVVSAAGKTSSYTVPGGGGGTTQPRPQQPNPYNPPSQPSQPAGPDYDVSEVNETANNQARMVANRVVNIFRGAQEVIRQYQNGFYSGISRYENSSVIDRLISQWSAQAAGSSAGQSDGDAAGRNQAQEQAELARREVTKRYSAAASGGALNNSNPRANCNVEVVMPPNHWQPVPGLYSQERFNQYNDTCYRDLNSFTGVYSYDGYSGVNFWNSYLDGITVWNLYSGRGGYAYARFVDDYYNRDERAWDAWRTRADWVGENPAYRQARDLYNGLSYDGRNAFVLKFKTVYNQVIREKWENPNFKPEVRAQIQQAYSRGTALGERIAEDYAKQQAAANAYRSAYRSAARSSYDSTCSDVWDRSWGQNQNRFDTSTVVTDANVKLQPSNGNAFLPWSYIDVSMTNVKNAGRKAGTTTVTTGSSTYVQGETKPSTKLLAKGTITRTPENVGYVGKITDKLPPNKPVQVAVMVGEAAYTTEVKISFYEVVKALGTENTQGLRDAYANYIRTYLTQEWAGDDYDKLIWEVKSASADCGTTAGCNKSGIAAYREMFKQIYGQPPGRFASAKKVDRYNKVMSILNAL